MLVLGAGGGVGIAAVEIGKAIGAKIVAAISSEEKAVAAREAGADATLTYPAERCRSENAFASVQGCGRTRQEPMSSSTLSAATIPRPRCAASPGKGGFWSSAFPAGIARLPLNLTLLKSCDVCGVFWGAFAARDPKANALHVEQLFRWLDEGKIAPKISATYTLERAGEAIAALRDRKAVGKLVVTL